MKLYVIKNSDYETKKVVWSDMEDALRKYKEHLRNSINADYSFMRVFESVTSCEYEREYNEEDRNAAFV